MSLRDEVLAEEARRRPGLPCPVGQALAGMPEAEELQALLDDQSVKGSVLAAVLTRRGYKVSADGVQRHRHHHVDGCKA